jgi:hypothetical protein
VTLHLYLSDNGFAIDDVLDTLNAGGAVPRRTVMARPLHVWLSGAFARPFSFGPVTGLKGWREAHEAAAVVAPAACGLQGPCVSYLEAEPSASAVLATAVEQSVVDGLRVAARARGLRVASMRPAWGRAIAAHGRGASADILLCCREHDSTTVLASRAGRLVFAATYSPAPTLDEQERLLSRLQASLGFAVENTARASVTAVSGGVALPPQVRWSEQKAELPA